MFIVSLSSPRERRVMKGRKNNFHSLTFSNCSFCARFLVAFFLILLCNILISLSILILFFDCFKLLFALRVGFSGFVLKEHCARRQLLKRHEKEFTRQRINTGINLHENTCNVFTQRPITRRDHREGGCQVSWLLRFWFLSLECVF